APTIDLPNVTGENDWYISSPVEITIQEGEDPDGSGVSKTEYRTKLEEDGSSWSNWKTYKDKIFIEDNGITRIQARTIDKAENEGDAKETVKIDNIIPKAPKITGFPTEDWTNQSVELFIQAKKDTDD